MKYYNEENRPKTAKAQGRKEKGIREVIKTEIVNNKVKRTLIKKVNEYEKIQTNKENSLLSNIIKRFQNGDINALNQKQVSYGDQTLMPKTIHEINEMSLKAKAKLENLPETIKEKILNGEKITKEEIIEAYKPTQKEENNNE